MRASALFKKTFYVLAQDTTRVSAEFCALTDHGEGRPVVWSLAFDGPLKKLFGLNKYSGISDRSVVPRDCVAGFLRPLAPTDSKLRKKEEAAAEKEEAANKNDGISPTQVEAHAQNVSQLTLCQRLTLCSNVFTLSHLSGLCRYVRVESSSVAHHPSRSSHRWTQSDPFTGS